MKWTVFYRHEVLSGSYSAPTARMKTVDTALFGMGRTRGANWAIGRNPSRILKLKELTSLNIIGLIPALEWFRQFGWPRLCLGRVGFGSGLPSFGPGLRIYGLDLHIARLGVRRASPYPNPYWVHKLVIFKDNREIQDPCVDYLKCLNKFKTAMASISIYTA